MPAEVAEPIGRLFRDAAKLGRKALDVARKLAANADGFLCQREGLFAAAELAEDVGQIVQGRGQTRQDGVGALFGDLAVDENRFLCQWQRLLVSAEVAAMVAKLPKDDAKPGR